MQITNETLAEVIALGGEMSNTTLKRIVALVGEDISNVRRRLSRMIGGGLIIKHSSDRDNFIDTTYSLSQKGSRFIDREVPKYSSRPGERLKRILKTDLMFHSVFSGAQVITVDEALSGSCGYCDIRNIKESQRKDWFRNNQSIGIYFLPHQIIVCYSLYPHMAFVEKNEGSVFGFLKRQIEYGSLKNRYTLQDIYYLFYYRGDEAYLNLLAARGGSGGSMKHFLKSTVKRGHGIFLDQTQTNTDITLLDLFSQPDYIGKTKNFFQRVVKKNYIQGFQSDGMLNDNPAILNPFMDITMITTMFQDIVSYRKTNNKSLKPTMLLFKDNIDIMSEVTVSRYPRSSPVKFIAIDYNDFRRGIGIAGGA